MVNMQEEVLIGSHLSTYYSYIYISGSSHDLNSFFFFFFSAVYFFMSHTFLYWNLTWREARK